MRFEVRYLPLAVQDLDQMTSYLLHFSPDTAGRTLREMEEKLASWQKCRECVRHMRRIRFLAGWLPGSIWYSTM